MEGSKYSQNLIDETIKIFKQEDDLDVSAETANDYLASFAGLFLALAGKETSADSLRVAEVSHVSFPLEPEPAFPKPEAGPR